MSEPVSNAEIEDVLSSIRRLVSENSDVPARGDAPGDLADKLVLTPAFRVLHTEEPDAAQPPGSPPEAPSDTWPEMADNAADHTGSPSDHAAAMPLVSDEIGDQGGDDFPTSDSDDLGHKIEVLEAAIRDSHEDWEPDDGEEAPQDDAPILLHRLHQTTETRTETHTETHTDNQAESAADIILDEAAIPTDISDAEIGTADSASTTAKGDDMSDADLDTALDGDTDTDTDSDADADGDSLYFDEEMLREMVTELVREELQGHVGERITRNVRRLVRREIKRALAVRDLE